MGEACLRNDSYSAEVKAALFSSSSEHQDCPWYALKVRTGSESMIVTLLKSRGFAPYCPTQKVRRQYSDRIKIVDAPVLPGYIFCRFDVQKKLPVISTPGVDYIVGFADGPTPIPEQQLVDLRRVIEAGASPVRFLTRGQKVRVTKGPLQGVEGVLIRDQGGDQLVVSIGLLQQGAALRVHECAVCPVA
jgi:transcription termination/antitermination protein NusG